ncbi:MAG: hypothetical protein ACFFA6_12870 [Promethearchaeota archaeon]
MGSKLNPVIYFYAYFSVEMILAYINSYLPIYFSTVISIDITTLSFVLFLSYLALFSRPFISLYFDRKNSRRKLFIIFSSFGIFLSFSILIFSLKLLPLFGTLLGIILILISVVTVGINKIMILQSPDKHTKNKNALIIMLGAICGSIIPIIIFLFNVSSSTNWNQFFIFGVLLSTPIIVFAFFLNDETTNYEYNGGNNQEVKIIKKPIILMCIFLFLTFSDRLFSFSIKPYISIKTSPTFFSILWFILTLIYALGNIFGKLILKIVNRKQIITISVILIGVLLNFIPFVNFFLFLTLYGFYFFLSGIFLISLLSIMMEISQNKVFYYQIMALFSVAANVIFTPLGTFLYQYIETELIIMIAGIIILISVIPIYFVKLNATERTF